jgi:hypothetical protein
MPPPPRPSPPPPGARPPGGGASRPAPGPGRLPTSGPAPGAPRSGAPPGSWGRTTRPPIVPAVGSRSAHVRTASQLVPRSHAPQGKVKQRWRPAVCARERVGSGGGARQSVCRGQEETGRPRCPPPASQPAPTLLPRRPPYTHKPGHTPGCSTSIEWRCQSRAGASAAAAPALSLRTPTSVSTPRSGASSENTSRQPRSNCAGRAGVGSGWAGGV